MKESKIDYRPSSLIENLPFEILELIIHQLFDESSKGSLIHSIGFVSIYLNKFIEICLVKWEKDWNDTFNNVLNLFVEQMMVSFFPGVFFLEHLYGIEFEERYKCFGEVDVCLWNTMNGTMKFTVKVCHPHDELFEIRELSKEQQAKLNALFKEFPLGFIRNNRGTTHVMNKILAQKILSIIDLTQYLKNFFSSKMIKNLPLSFNSDAIKRLKRLFLHMKQDNYLKMLRWSSLNNFSDHFIITLSDYLCLYLLLTQAYSNEKNQHNFFEFFGFFVCCFDEKRITLESFFKLLTDDVCSFINQQPNFYEKKVLLLDVMLLEKYTKLMPFYKWFLHRNNWFLSFLARMDEENSKNLSPVNNISIIKDFEKIGERGDKITFWKTILSLNLIFRIRGVRNDDWINPLTIENLASLLKKIENTEILSAIELIKSLMLKNVEAREPYAKQLEACPLTILLGAEQFPWTVQLYTYVNNYSLGRKDKIKENFVLSLANLAQGALCIDFQDKAGRQALIFAGLASLNLDWFEWFSNHPPLIYNIGFFQQPQLQLPQQPKDSNSNISPKF